MKTLFKMLTAVIVTACAGSASAQIAVVVSAKSDVAAMTSDQVAALFLGKSDKFPAGGKASLLDQAQGSPVRVSFYEKVAGKNESQVKAVWSRLAFSGTGTPPKEVANSAEVKKLVAANPNAVGYIEKSAVDASVKVIMTAE